jgi:hypothetical protein
MLLVVPGEDDEGKLAMTTEHDAHTAVTNYFENPHLRIIDTIPGRAESIDEWLLLVDHGGERWAVLVQNGEVVEDSLDPNDFYRNKSAAGGAR